ncbi:hypothetical protein Tco_0383127 [Tanacetum coccineum]
MRHDYYSPMGVSKALVTYPMTVDAREERHSWDKFTNDVLCYRGTDISKITRKRSKSGKHGHEKRKSTREAKDSKPKPEKVKPWSTMGQQKSNTKGQKSQVTISVPQVFLKLHK